MTKRDADAEKVRERLGEDECERPLAVVGLSCGGEQDCGECRTCQTHAALDRVLSRREKYEAVVRAAREVAIEVTGFSFESGAPQPLTCAVRRLDEAISTLQEEEG